MSSKKSAKGAKKKVDAVGDKDKESLKLAQSEIAHLQQHIELQKHDMVEARRMERLWRQRCEENQAEFAREKQDLEDIAKARARKSTVQSDQKQITIEGLEAKIESVQRENCLFQSQLETLENKNAAAAGEHAIEVKELRQRIQCMHSEFAQLMTQTVETFKKQLLHPYIGDLGLQDDTTAQAHEGGAHCQD